jgi:L-arabinose isomerase
MSILPDMKTYEAWFITGSQHLYGPETLAQVAEHSAVIARNLDSRLPVKVVLKPTVKTPEEIGQVLSDAQAAPRCIGVITWMHTFSPAKMWINGLSGLKKPMAHLHTQYNRDLPWSKIDMDFMNLNQAAHGDREFGHICSRLGVNRTVIVGHWEEAEVCRQLSVWSRAAVALADMRSAKVARFGDNMREVSVTEGDKVAFQMALGASVNGYGVGDLVAEIDARTPAEVDALLSEYDKAYDVSPELRAGGKKREELRQAARIEAGMRSFLAKGKFSAFTTTFEDLHGIAQLPGLACQRLMADGYGFGAEGDWKTAVLVRAMKVMAAGLPGGTSFMEDYTYHLDPANSLVLGAHMLEVCPSIAAAKPKLRMEPLGIGGKDDPARLVFETPAGKGVNASLVGMGDRFRLIINPCRVVNPPEPMPKLPVATAVWEPEPNLRLGAAAWIHSGGAHHTGFSMAIGAEELETFAEMAGLECVMIDSSLTDLRKFVRELRLIEGLRR